MIQHRAILSVTVAAIGLLCQARAQQPWQTDYGKFLDEVGPFVATQPSPRLTAEILEKFGGKEVTWTGTFETIAHNKTRNAPIVHLVVPSRKMRIPSGVLYDSVPSLDLFPLPPNVPAWERLRQGQRVTFLATLIAPVFEALSFINVVNFYLQDAQVIDPAAVPVIARAGVVNGASFLPGIAAGAWFTIQGSNLAPTTRVWRDADFNGRLLPRSLDGVSVKINGKDAFVAFISPGQINALAPADSALGPVTVTVTTPAGTSAPETAELRAYSPEFFRFEGENRKYLAAVHSDGVLAAKQGFFGGSVISRPAKAGERILLFGTGFGLTSPPVPSGQIFAGAAPLADPFQLGIRIGGLPAVVEFTGAISPGLYQFNVIVPSLPEGDHVVAVSIGGFDSAPGTSIAVTQ